MGLKKLNDCTWVDDDYLGWWIEIEGHRDFKSGEKWYYWTAMYPGKSRTHQIEGLRVYNTVAGANRVAKMAAKKVSENLSQFLGR